MTVKFHHLILGVFLLLISLLHSCTEPDSVTIIEMEEELDFVFEMKVSGITMQTDAVAAYCLTDTSEFIIISNKPEHLGFPVHSENLEEGDFVFLTNISHVSDSWGHGSQIFGEEVTGSTERSVYVSDALIDITSNNGEVVVGSSEGLLIDMDAQGNMNELAYSIEFISKIIHESNFCSQ